LSSHLNTSPTAWRCDVAPGPGNAGHDHDDGNAALNAIASIDTGDAHWARASTYAIWRRRHWQDGHRRRVTRVDGKRIEFQIEASDGGEKIGNGTHERMVIDLPKFSERLKAKSARGMPQPG
jgi:fluoroacetyl-CoA thioesterase